MWNKEFQKVKKKGQLLGCLKDVLLKKVEIKMQSNIW